MIAAHIIVGSIVTLCGLFGLVSVLIEEAKQAEELDHPISN